MRAFMIKKLIGASLLASFLLAASALAFVPPSESPAPSSSTGPGPGVSPSPRPKPTPINTACMQAAVDKRDGAVIAGLDAYYPSVKSALEARRSALKAAWGLSERKARREAIRVAWDAFKGTWRTASKNLRNAKNAAWKQFNADAKACKVNPSAEGENGQSLDAGL